MPQKFPFLALGALLVLATGLMAAVGDSPKVTPVTLEPIDGPQFKGSMAACTMYKHNGTPTSYFGAIAQGDQFVTYFDPLACGQSPTYPFEITDLSVMLYNFAGAVWPVQLDVVVYGLAQTPDSCSGPGQELCRFTITCDQATWSYPNYGTATFPTPCCVYAPFYIGIQYTDQGAGPYPSFLMDGQTADTCDNWGYRNVWYEWYDFWSAPVPGYLIYWVDGETNSPNCEPEMDTCEYYKAGYIDYCPNGMPDFDQKQDQWISPINQQWSWCGPVALANCIWWFDSKFEPNPIPPPIVNDNYPLVQDYTGGQIDDHHPNNVMPFISLLKPMCFTDVAQPGTLLPDLEVGFHNWIAAMGLANKYTTYVVIGPEFQQIKDSILSSQDVILLLGFYELIEGNPENCQWLGGHYVTAAGVCLEETDICISDPYFDGNEGEPPIGVHGSAVHNDAALVSGPHGTHHHDRYSLMPKTVCPSSPATWMFMNYPNSWMHLYVFENQNPISPMPAVGYQGGPVVVMLDAAIIICPKPGCCNTDGIRGDVDYSGGSPNVADVTYLVYYLFKHGPEPPCFEEGDVDGNGSINVSDVTYLVYYLFKHGPAPAPCP